MGETKASLWARSFEYFSKHPIVFLIGLAGAIASIYFGFWPKYPHRELTYAIQPVRTAIVQVNQKSDIVVTYKGKPVVGDLEAAQIMIANAGQEPIERNDILSPLALVVSNATIVERSLSVPAKIGTEFTLSTNLGTPRLSLDWKVLERGDNPVIQVLYAGERNASIALEGRTKGQEKPTIVAWPSAGKIPRVAQLMLSACAGMMFSLLAVLARIVFRRPMGQFEKTMGIIGLTVFAGVAFLLFKSFY
jgi:hypothetical protein